MPNLSKRDARVLVTILATIAHPATDAGTFAAALGRLSAIADKHSVAINALPGFTAEHAAIIAKRATPEPDASADATPEPDATAKPDASPAKPDMRLADRAAQSAVKAFYRGASLPFKAANKPLADINFHNVKRPSARTAALCAAIIAYADADTFNRDGTFKRGAFRVPASLAGGDGETLVSAMPESGCFGNQLSRTFHYVSGPIGGRTAGDAVYRADFAAIETELSHLPSDLPGRADVFAKLAAIKAACNAA